MKKIFLDRCTRISKTNCNDINRGFISRFLSYTSLPHSDPRTKYFERNVKFGEKTIRVSISSPNGIPYGIIPRKLFAWIGKLAVQGRSPSIDLGRSQKFFLEQLDCMNTGGKNGSITSLKKQAEKLFSSTISVECKENQRWQFKRSSFTKESNILWTPNDKKNIWTGKLELDPTFFEELLTLPVPVDMRIVTSLSSSLALDIYFWLNFKRHHTRAPVNISWEQIFLQFGGGYESTPKRIINFRDFFIKQLNKVKALDPSIKIIVLNKKRGLLIGT